MSEEVMYPSAFALEETNIRYLEGRLLTLLESLGLPSGQEQAIKGLVRDEVWRLVEYGTYLSSELHTKAHEESVNTGQTNTGQTKPSR